MSRLSHPICAGCWKKREPFRTPLRLYVETERCCFCGADTDDGIYMRELVENVPACTGSH